MAQMIPDRLPSASSMGEKRLFDILQRMPEDWVVYFEPVIAGRYPDFIIIAPSLGIIVIEVKGWLPGDILSGDLHEVRVRMRQVESREVHPVRQARTYQNNLRDECRKTREATALLLNPSGPHEGKFRFPFCHFAVLSNITTEQISHHKLGDLTTLFPPKRVLARDRLLAWEQLPVSAVVAAITTFFDPFWPIKPMTARQVDVLRAVIHPEIRIEREPDPIQLSILDTRQERHAFDIGSGHRIVYGVAGSGKTVLLIARAKLLSAQHPSHEILVLCFNVSLAAYLRSVLAGCMNVVVLHFDAWAKTNNIVRQRPQREGEPSESHESLGGRLLEALRRGDGDAQRFDAVLIDEAQDFDPTWFHCVREAMKDPNEGDLLIVGDRQQGLYTAKPIVWSHLGISAQGRTIHKAFDLDKNYRNSREIVALAAAFASAQTETASDDHFALVPLDPTKSIRAVGVKPMLIACRSRRDECRHAIGIVASLLHLQGAKDPRIAEPLVASDIGILYPRLLGHEANTLKHMMDALRRFVPVVWLKDENREAVCQPGIKVQTIHSAKGLQYKAVLLLWADLLPRPFGNTTLAEERNLLYVALTRPEDYLFITHSEQSPFIDDLRATGLMDSF